MTDEVLSLKIAEFLEPNPIENSTPRDWKPYRTDNPFAHKWISPKGCWFMNSVESLDRTLIARSMVTDPAMTVMLMEKIVKSQGAERGMYQIGKRLTQLVHQDDWQHDAETFLRRAIAEEFANEEGLL